MGGLLLAFSSGMQHIACGASGGTEINGSCVKKVHLQKEGVTTPGCGEIRPLNASTVLVGVDTVLQ